MMEPNQLVSRTAKQFSMVACVIGALVGWFLTAIVAWGLIAKHTLYHNGKPVWIGVVILGYFSFALSWFAVRLIRRPLPLSGQTMMPRWFLIATVAFFAGCILIVLIANVMQTTQ